MSRIIMLIPLDEDVGLTTISLSIMYFFNKYKFKNKCLKSILYFSCTENLLDDTKLIISKYFSSFITLLDTVNFSKLDFNSSEYYSCLNKIIEDCYDKKFLHELVLIEGMHHKYNINSEQINYDISQNLSAEVIFISTLDNNSFNCIQKKEQYLKLFLRRKKYKNILGIIFNKVNSPFQEKKYDFIKKLNILKTVQDRKQDEIFRQNFFNDINIPILACIPWNKNIVKTTIIDIYNFLRIEHIYLTQKTDHIIEEIIIFDESYINMLNKFYLNTLIIISFSRIDVLIKIFYLILKKNEIKCIIITGLFESKENIMSLCEIFMYRHISVFFTQRNTLEIISKLQNFNFNINIKDKKYIQKLQTYISSFFSYSSIIMSKKQSNYRVQYSPQEFCSHLKLLSSKKNKRIILPESYETRILKAVSVCYDYNIAQCILLGDPKKIYSIAKKKGIKISKKIEIINASSIRNNYITRFLELRSKKGLDELSAKKQLYDNTILATLILESGLVDGLVSGSVNTTSNTIRPALQIIKTHTHSRLVSSIFFMLLPNEVFIYGDCALNINPTAEELSEIAIQSADSMKIFGIEPRIAMLSYSTGYSGIGCQVEKVRNATVIIKSRRPDLIIDGPIQYDAAVSKEVAKLKAPSSPLLGSANIFIFPDLNSGNIAYKAVQRSANIISIGPILQGLKKPVNDLSRGASVEDIIYTIALTSIQSL